MKRNLVFSIFSTVIPLATWLVFLTGLAPATHSDFRAYLPLLGFNALGFVLSALALSQSNPRPVDTSFPIRMIALFASLGLVANTIAVEMIISAVLSAAHS